MAEEGPANVLPGHPARHMRILVEVSIVIERDKAIAKGRQEDPEDKPDRQKADQDRPSCAVRFRWPNRDRGGALKEESGLASQAALTFHSKHEEALLRRHGRLIR
jgi:hypothetical protein